VIKPHCAVCGFNSRNPVAGGVKFADYHAEPGVLATPNGWAAFCRQHLELAEKYRHLPIRDAFEHIATDLPDQRRPPSSAPGNAERYEPVATADSNPLKTRPAPTMPYGPANPSTVEQTVPSDAERPDAVDARWPVSQWYGAGAGATAPPCPRCRRAVRTDTADRDRPLPGYANPPWNAGWDERFEACGAAFELVVHTPLHFGVDRTTTVRPASRPYQTFIDEGFVLSGVEVTVVEREWGTDLPRTQTLFLSMAELTQLAGALQNSLRIYLEQFDWAHDWT